MARYCKFTSGQLKNASFSNVPATTGTISIWIRPHWNSGDSVTHVFWAHGLGSNLPSFQKYSDNKVYCGFSAGVDYRIVIADTGLFTNGTWANWVFTYSNAAGQVLYKDTVSVGTNPVTIPALTSGASVGNYVSPSANANSDLAEYCFWNVILTAGEIAGLSSGRNCKSIRPGNIVIQWPLGGIESPEPDFSGLTLNATITTATSCVYSTHPSIAMFTPRWPNNILPTSAPSVTALFRKTFSGIGTRTGARQTVA